MASSRPLGLIITHISFVATHNANGKEFNPGTKLVLVQPTALVSGHTRRAMVDGHMIDLHDYTNDTTSAGMLRAKGVMVDVNGNPVAEAGVTNPTPVVVQVNEAAIKKEVTAWNSANPKDVPRNAAQEIAAAKAGADGVYRIRDVTTGSEKLVDANLNAVTHVKRPCDTHPVEVKPVPNDPSKPTGPTHPGFNKPGTDVDADSKLLKNIKIALWIIFKDGYSCERRRSPLQIIPYC